MSRGFALITVGARGGVRHCWGNVEFRISVLSLPPEK